MQNFISVRILEEELERMNIQEIEEFFFELKFDLKEPLSMERVKEGGLEYYEFKQKIKGDK